jgi:FkbM family methyltransferase
MIEGQHTSLGALQQRWRRELIGNVMPADGGYFIDVGARMGEALIDLQCAMPMSRYVGFEPCRRRAEYIGELTRMNAIPGWQVVPAALGSASTVRELPRGAPSRYAAGLVFDEIRDTVAPGPVRMVHIRVGGAEAEVLAGMRATLKNDRPVLLGEVRFAATEDDREAERERKEALQDILREHCYVILQLVINGQGDIVGGARMPDFPLAVESPANRLQRDYIMLPLEELNRLKRHLY